MSYFYTILHVIVYPSYRIELVIRCNTLIVRQCYSLIILLRFSTFCYSVLQ